MTTGTSIKDRCRLCYTRLKDISSSSPSSSLHHKIWCSHYHNRIYNIYKRRPFRYRDLIVRYLSINLPENNFNDHYSNIICGTCATSLTKLETLYRTFEQTQKILRSKFHKTSQITRYQLDKQIKNVTQQKISMEQKIHEPKRLSKRKGAPKHIDQTLNHNKKPTTSGVQLIVKIPSSNHDNESIETQNLFLSSSSSSLNKRTSPRRKHDILNETTNQKKKFKSSTKDHELSNITSNNESYNCINLLKSSILTDTSINNLSSLNLTTPGSISSSSRSFNSVKGNHIERIAVSLLSGTETLSDIGNNGISDVTSDHNTSKTRAHRKPTLSAVAALEATTTNNILSSSIPTTYTNVATILSPSLDEQDDDDGLSTGDISNDSSNISTNGLQQNLNKQQLSSTISTTPTSEGLTITAINQTGQKQVFMAKQLGNLKKYQCGLCEKIVTNIQIHVRRHTNDKPYPCTYCEKRFTNSGDLQIHVRIHTGEKPYACPLCLKSYRTIGNFNSHVKTHDSGTRPHRCELCNQTFPIPKDWYSHLRSSHRSRIPNNNLSTTTTTTTTTTNTNSSLNSTNATTTVTQPLFSNALSSQQQHNEIFVPNKVKLEPINRSQLIIKSSNIDDQEPVNMSKKENSNDIDEDEENDDVDEDEVENHHQSTHNLLTSVSSPVHA
ncbi:unnamed protein product [Rotaria sordida]|uniref:Uncharacterized protein n=1 Tax=Rotaria sordida TaxID=392033 RepID=A0A819CDG6_9BILA|nr:unnamed protein product [Rotaria sordida]CAF3810169.1 unnamed protein product [Rotaria sordida]